MLTLKIQYSKCAGGKNDDRNNEEEKYPYRRGV